MSLKDANLFRQKVDECVRESQKDVYRNAEDSNLRFTDEELSHQVLRDLLKANVRDVNSISKQAVLAMIDKASKV